LRNNYAVYAIQDFRHKFKSPNMLTYNCCISTPHACLRFALGAFFEKEFIPSCTRTLKSLTLKRQAWYVCAHKKIVSVVCTAIIFLNSKLKNCVACKTSLPSEELIQLNWIFVY